MPARRLDGWKGGIVIFKFVKKKETIQFSGRRHTRLGILSAVIGIVSVIGFIIVSIVSGINGGEGGLIIGIAGILLFALSLLGFIMSYKALKQKDIFYRFPMTGLVVNGIMMIVYVILYVMGIGV
mgnify:FL=1